MDNISTLETRGTIAGLAEIFVSEKCAEQNSAENDEAWNDDGRTRTATEKEQKKRKREIELVLDRE